MECQQGFSKTQDCRFHNQVLPPRGHRLQEQSVEVPLSRSLTRSSRIEQLINQQSLYPLAGGAMKENQVQGMNSKVVSTKDTPFKNWQFE